MSTGALSTSFPFTSADLTQDNGILYGINMHNSGLVIFDRFSLENGNSVVFAKSGAGKSFAVKLEAFECGIKAASDSRGRYTVRFYITAILFVIFDVETVFLFPWAVRYRQLQWFGVAEVGLFLVILAVGYIWAYKKGALEWV